MISTVKDESGTEREIKDSVNIIEIGVLGSSSLSTNESPGGTETHSDEQRLIRRLDRRILTIISLMYFFVCTLPLNWILSHILIFVLCRFG